jgi:LmbE family N-acetylglucosaminyl deacetylase
MTQVSVVLRAFRELPFADLDNVVRADTAMIIAPHADDESLGCGGLIAQLCARKRFPVVVIVTDGTGSHRSSRLYPSARLRSLREQEARRAVTILGLPLDRLIFLRLPDGAVPVTGPEFAAAVTHITNLARAYGCNTILAPWLYDPHGDHEAAQIMARSVGNIIDAVVLSYPVWGWLLPYDSELPEVSPQGWRLDITQNVVTKQRAIAAHVSQYTDLIRDDPDGFRLPAELLAVFEAPYEVFLSK